MIDRGGLFRDAARRHVLDGAWRSELAIMNASHAVLRQGRLSGRGEQPRAPAIQAVRGASRRHPR